MNAPGKPGQFIPEQVTFMTLPVISRSRFAELIGIEEGVVQGWISKGYIPTYSVGKYQFALQHGIVRAELELKRRCRMAGSSSWVGRTTA